MKKKILTLLAAVCLLSAVLSGCGGGSQAGTTEIYTLSLHDALPI